MFWVLRLFFVGFTFLGCLSARAQYQHQASAQVQLPVGAFQRTHTAGLGLSYQWSPQRFGYLDAMKQRLSWGLLAGVNAFAGKQETEAGYRYRHGVYFNSYITGGALYNPFADVQIYLGAGPVLGFYRGGLDVGAMIIGGGTLQLTPNWSVGPYVSIQKYRHAASLWTTQIKVGYSF